ncbi:MAG TPA: HNH endonuclease signature motif containing protein [Candidatus Dormibacteraeota bacterium]
MTRRSPASCSTPGRRWSTWAAPCGWPGATRAALNFRDKGCRWPGCDRPASWTAAHHVIHWAQGGRTDLDNLVYR